MVINDSEQAPPALAGESVEGLPDLVANAYLEARKTAGIAAFASCELMYRKILMNIAVDKGAEPGGSFASYLDYLRDKGYTNTPMKPWVDFIRKRGNGATHEIVESDKEQALSTLAFTAQLLRLVYEMDYKVSQFVKPDAQGK